MRARRLAALLAGLALLTGCTETPSVTRAAASESATPPPASVPTVDARDLAAAKAAAGIEDCPESTPAADPVARGLPAVTLPCLGGGRAVSLAGLRGEPTLVNVWAQWCGPCRDEAPHLAAVAADPADLRVLGVDYADPRPDYAIEFARAAGWRYPQLQDAGSLLKAPLQIAGPPLTLFVRPDGAVAYTHRGPFTSAEQVRDLARTHLGVAS